MLSIARISLNDNLFSFVLARMRWGAALPTANTSAGFSKKHGRICAKVNGFLGGIVLAAVY